MRGFHQGDGTPASGIPRTQARPTMTTQLFAIEPSLGSAPWVLGFERILAAHPTLVGRQCCRCH